MQHGGKTIPSVAFNGGRTLNLPAQTNQGATPVLPRSAITSVSVANSAKTTNVSWLIDEDMPPQLSTKIEIISVVGEIVKTVQDTLPEKRSHAINTAALQNGRYTIRVQITDIFNQQSEPVINSFVVAGRK